VASTPPRQTCCGAARPFRPLVGTKSFTADTAGQKGQFVCIEGFGQLTVLVVEAVGTYGVGLSLFAQRTASKIMEVR
jgi:hypothetical protein